MVINYYIILSFLVGWGRFCSHVSSAFLPRAGQGTGVWQGFGKGPGAAAETLRQQTTSGVGGPCCRDGGIALGVLPPHHPVVGTITVVILCAREISVPVRLAIAHSFTETFTLTRKYHSSESILKTHRQKFRKSVIYPGQSLHHYW